MCLSRVYCKMLLGHQKRLPPGPSKSRTVLSSCDIVLVGKMQISHREYRGMVRRAPNSCHVTSTKNYENHVNFTSINAESVSLSQNIT